IFPFTCHRAPSPCRAGCNRHKSKRFSVKRIHTQLVLLLLVVNLAIPTYIVAQQRPQTSSGTSSGSERGSFGYPGRKTRSSATSAAAAVVERDFDEALRVIQEQYVDGRKLNYNDVFKSSIIGMLRSLDPHSNYYDREEFDELKTDQRSEYFGIGASIQS